MGLISLGPKGSINQKVAGDIAQALVNANTSVTNTIVQVEKTVEVPVEKIVTVIKEVPVEVEKLVHVDRIVEVIKEVPVEVEKIVEVIKHVEVKVEKIVQMPIHVIKRVEVEVTKVPKFVWIIMAIQTLAIVGLLIK
jgi:hypothetical protein